LREKLQFTTTGLGQWAERPGAVRYSRHGFEIRLKPLAAPLKAPRR